MDGEGISYEMLQDLVRAERRSNRLSPVQSRFWAELRAFLDDIKAGFREEQQKDPFGRRAMMARDEAQHAIQAAESLWSLRERKMSLYALAQPKTGDVERPEGLTAEEMDLYDIYVQALRLGKAKVFGESPPAPPAPAPSRQGSGVAPGKALGGASTQAPTPAPESPPEVAEPETPATPPPSEPAPPAAAPPAPSSSGEPIPPDLDEPPVEVPEADPDPEMHAAPTPPTAPAPAPHSPAPEAPAPTVVPSDTPDDEMVTIRALGDIPPFVGPDMQTYLLREGDFATVPPAIARLLEKRQKAEIMQT